VLDYCDSAFARTIRELPELKRSVLLLLAGGIELTRAHPLGGGGAGMTGIVMTLHFGLFHLLSLGWRRRGVDAPPIINAPAAAS